jgi:hypothetical protein
MSTPDGLCENCPPVGYPTDATRCLPCPRRQAVDYATAEEIDAARTPAGGWSATVLAGWGIPWPPPRGWRQRLIANHAAHQRAGTEPQPAAADIESVAWRWIDETYPEASPGDRTFDADDMVDAYLAGAGLAIPARAPDDQRTHDSMSAVDD